MSENLVNGELSLEQVKAYFEEHGLANRIHEFDRSSATVELAALALNCEPQRIAKTLSFMIDDQAALIVTAGDARIDNAKFKSRFLQKARMLSPEQAIELVGFPIGGVCPFVVPAGVKVYLDESLRRFTTVYPACGSANSAIELTLDELDRHARPTAWVDVCKAWQATDAQN